jgi:putative endonuclease
MSVFTYLIRSLVDGSYYVGISESPIKRLTEHNSGKLKITSGRKPYELVYCREHQNYQEARNNEKWLKKKNRDYKNRLAQLAPPI